MKTIIAVGDGMADNPVPMLSGKTPLEASHTPTLDSLAQQGLLGHVRTIPEGIPPGSDTAFLSILGYDPRRYFSGRGPLEAAGSGVSLVDGDVAYRCNLVALEDGPGPLGEKRILSHSGGSVDEESALALMDSLLADPDFAALAQKHGMTFHKMPAFRQIAVQKGQDIEGLVTIPPHDHLGEEAGPLLPSGSGVAAGLREMMELAHRILDPHPVNQTRRAQGLMPANGIWFWAQGRTIALDNFTKLHGVKGCVVSAVPLVHGIGALAGLHSLYVEGATGELDTNFEGKAAGVLRGLLEEGYDFALLHVEAPDECTHNGDTQGKVKAIEAFDSRTLKPLLEGLRASGQAFRLLVMSDHKTLTATRGHDGDPVPYILYDSRGTAGPHGTAYTEAAGAKGPFLPEGHHLVAQLLQQTN